MNSLFAEAVRLQEAQERSGFQTPNPILSRLLAEVEPEVLLHRARQLRTGGVKERKFHAVLLASVDLSSDRRLAEVLRTLEEESDPGVIGWLVLALRDIALPLALSKLRELADHPSERVRFSVPDALSACGTRFDDVADVMLQLSRDVDPDVRWSAIFELGAWWTVEQDPRIGARLQEAVANDPSGEVRGAAADGLAGNR